jgi:membrane protease YdiL (CAAX protease family)
MVSEKPWKAEAMLRLAASVAICIFLGALLSEVLRVLLHAPGTGSRIFLMLTFGAVGLLGGALLMLGRPWPPDRVGRNFLILMICFYGGVSLTWGSMRCQPAQAARLEPSALDVVIAVLAFHGAALVLMRWFLKEHRVGWAEAFGFRRESSRSLLLGMAAAFLFLPLGWGLQAASTLILDQLHMPAQEQQAVQVLRETESWGSGILLGLAAILVAPAAEEILFRGILYPAAKQWGFPRLAWWGTAVLFGAIHCNLATFLPLTILALVLTWLYERTDNLLAPIAAHTLFNGLNFAALFFGQWLEHLSPKP